MKSKKGMKSYCDEKTLKKGFSSTKIKDWTNQREYSQKEMPEDEYSSAMKGMKDEKGNGKKSS